MTCLAHIKMPMKKLTHINTHGEATMVDVGNKPQTARIAVAHGKITMNAETLVAIENHMLKKGDVLATARIAGIMAGKQTATLIPLCHPLAITSIDIQFAIFRKGSAQGIECTTTAKTFGQTGVEMEALTAVSVALLTIYDMAKAMDRSMQISAIRLLEKDGGQSGHWQSPD